MAPNHSSRFNMSGRVLCGAGLLCVSSQSHSDDRAPPYAYSHYQEHMHVAPKTARKPPHEWPGGGGDERLV